MGSIGLRRLASITLATAFLFTVFVIGCASGPHLRHKHAFKLSPGQEHHAGLGRALLLPINSTNEEVVAGLEIANDRITALIVSHLESKGISVERVEPERFARAANAGRAAVRADRGSGESRVLSTEVEFEDVVPEILEALDQTPDLVIAPNLVMRHAVYEGTRTIAWDGVKRRESVYDSRMTGSTAAASIQVTIHAKDGAVVFSGYGGLEPAFRIDHTQQKYVQREDLFQDERNLREGICIAFYPYFGMEEHCVR